MKLQPYQTQAQNRRISREIIMRLNDKVKSLEREVFRYLTENTLLKRKLKEVKSNANG